MWRWRKTMKFHTELCWQSRLRGKPSVLMLLGKKYNSVLQKMKLRMHARHWILPFNKFGRVSAHASTGLWHFLAPMILYLHFLKFNPARLSLCVCLSRGTAPSSVPPGKSAGRAGKGSFQKWRRGQSLLRGPSRSCKIQPFWSVAYR
jgi:hypothetical protein